MLKNHENDYTIIVTQRANENISNLLKTWKFSEGSGFYFAIDVEASLLNRATGELFHLLDTIKQTNKVIVLLPPSLATIRNPSDVEAALTNWQKIISQSSRIEWLKSNPPHIQQAHSELPHYSDDYIKNIFTGENPILIDNVYSQPAHQSKYVNVANGLRYTTNQPTQYDSIIHCIGNSHTYGFGQEDYFTFSSCLQRILQHRQPDTYKVVNHSVRGLRTLFYSDKISSIALEENDVLICHLPSNDRTKTWLANSGVSHIDLTDFFHRPHNLGELFFDTHLNYKGSRHTAKIVADTFFKSKKSNPTNSLPTSKQSTIVENPLFGAYLARAKDYVDSINIPSDTTLGSIVMNCNPFTLGHLHLIELAAKMVDHLFIFVVEEDLSYFPFKDRFELIKAGTQHLNNVHILPSGQFIISNVTFPEYFDKDALQESKIDPSLDLNIFCEHIAKPLGITIRFAGEEPHDAITQQYNDAMSHILPRYGMKFVEIPRKKSQGSAISASSVRRLLESGRIHETKSLVPSTTYDYLVKTSTLARNRK